PFTTFSSSVTQVPSNTGWCTMMSSTSSLDGIYTRGIAQPDLCSSTGCLWKMVGRVNTWLITIVQIVHDHSVLTVHLYGLSIQPQADVLR
ncbi:unnamed protein product, partial [Rotaria sordida]